MIILMITKCGDPVMTRLYEDDDAAVRAFDAMIDGLERDVKNTGLFTVSMFVEADCAVI